MVAETTCLGAAYAAALAAQDGNRSPDLRAGEDFRDWEAVYDAGVRQGDFTRAHATVGEAVGLHPVWVLLALAIAGYFFGFVGLLIAVPLAVLVKLLVRYALEQYRASTVFRGDQPEVGSA